MVGIRGWTGWCWALGARVVYGCVRALPLGPNTYGLCPADFRPIDIIALLHDVTPGPEMSVISYTRGPGRLWVRLRSPRLLLPPGGGFGDSSSSYLPGVVPGRSLCVPCRARGGGGPATVAFGSAKRGAAVAARLLSPPLGFGWAWRLRPRCRRRPSGPGGSGGRRQACGGSGCGTSRSRPSGCWC